MAMDGWRWIDGMDWLIAVEFWGGWIGSLVGESGWLG